MAWAVCTQCGRAIKWYAGRGCRLRDLRCPVCGGVLKGCSMDRALEIHRSHGYQRHEVLNLRPDGVSIRSLKLRW